MKRLFAAVYIVPQRRVLPATPSHVCSAFHAASSAQTFPFDIGDDPSFFSATHLHGPVTWGVCRPDVRGKLRAGDWVTFFSAEKCESITTYSFVAALEAERFTSHAKVWQDEVPQLREYLNLLIRPHGTEWEHHEPGLHPRQWHDDWLWRMCVRSGLRKQTIVAAAQAHAPGTTLDISGTPVPIAQNYVVFRRDYALVSRNPVKVASHVAGDDAETWDDAPVPGAIRQIVFGESDRALRTRNRQQPHRHIRRDIPDGEAWISQLRSILSPAG